MVEALTQAPSEQQEQIKAVLEFLQKQQTRQEALDIILAYSTTKENRALFSGLDTCTQLLRLLPEGDVSHKVVQCLINFSVDTEYQRELVNLNVAGRVFDFLKDNVKMDMKSLTNQESVAFNEDDKVYEIRNRLKKGDS